LLSKVFLVQVFSVQSGAYVGAGFGAKHQEADDTEYAISSICVEKKRIRNTEKIEHGKEEGGVVLVAVACGCSVETERPLSM